MNIKLAIRNKKRKLATEFDKLTGYNFAPYSDSIFGFDVIALDRILKPQDGVATAEKLEQMHGSRARVLVEKILRLETALSDPTRKRGVKGSC